MTDKDILGEHQRQCDHRYVGWSWLAGILLTLTLTGGGVGWAANDAIRNVGTETDVLADSVVAHETRNVADHIRLRAEVDSMKARIATLDTLKRWMPRVEGKVDEIHRLVRK